MCSRRRRLRALLGSVVLLLLSVGFLVAALYDRGGSGKATSVTASAGRVDQDFEHLVEFERGGKPTAHLRLDVLAYVSRRRVPNGADPIHNRGEGKSARPPGRV